MSYAQSINGLDTELQTGRVAQDISDLDISLNSAGAEGITLISPANGEVNVAVTTSFEWDSATNYDGYKLVFADNQALTNPTEYYITGKTFTVPVDLSASTTYYWKVVGGDEVSNTPLVGQGGFTGMTVWDANNDPAPIYVYDQAAPRTVEAANDLATYIETSSGKTKPTVTSVSDSFSFPSRCIKVGFPETFTEREETLIKCVDGGPIELTGVDEYDASNPNYNPNPDPGEETDFDYMIQAGTYHVVMTFLMNYVGVVWGWQGDIGEAVPTNTELKVATVNEKRAPSCLVRNPLPFSDKGNASPYGIGKKWLKRQRAFWSVKGLKGHGFEDYYNRFHPNEGGNRLYIFALQPNGTRGTFPVDNQGNIIPEYVKMEVSNLDLPDIWFDVNVEEELAKNPLAETFLSAFNDSHSAGHTVDADAKAMDYNEFDAETVTLQYAGGTETVNSITDREILFSKRCSQNLNATYPDKYNIMLAYGPTRIAPKREGVDDKLIISNVANDFQNPNSVDSTSGQTHRQNFDDWLTAYSANQIWRPNLGNGYGHSRGMWLTHVHSTMARLKAIIPQGCIGFTPDNFWEHYSTQWPMYYTAVQLMYDNSKTIDEILDNAYDTLFGDAAPHIKLYYEYTEGVIDDNPAQSLSIRRLPSVWTNTVVSILEGHIADAIAATTPGSDERLRVEWVQAGLNWSKAVIQACLYWIQYNAPGEITDEENLADNANAIETDVDGNAGWTGRFGDAPTSQSGETNGSNFAFILDATNNTHLIVTREDLPGTASDMYVVTLDMKHSGTGGKWALSLNGNFIIDIRPDNTDWNTYQFAAYGTDTIEIRELNDDDDGIIYVDNFKIQAADPIDQTAIAAEWNDANDQAIADIVEAAKWTTDLENPSRPIGTAAIATERFPRPSTQDNDPNPNLV